VTTSSTRSTRRFVPTLLALALASAALVQATTAEAARIGHSRVVSPQGAPLQVDVSVNDILPGEAAGLRIGIAPESAWHQAGLTPPVALDSLTLAAEPGRNAESRTVHIRSTQAPTTQALDLLLELDTENNRQYVQVSVLVPDGAPVAPRLATPAPATTPASQNDQGTTGSVQVRQGDTLFAMARRYGQPGTSELQMLAAFWRANPDAFIQNNMNLLRAGSTLRIPDAAEAQAISTAEATRLYREQAQAFAQYRGDVARGVRGGQAALGGQAGQGALSGASVRGAQSAPVDQDRLQLSADTVTPQSLAAARQALEDARADARSATGEATRQAQDKVAELERNILEMQSLLASRGTADGNANTSGQSGNNQTESAQDTTEATNQAVGTSSVTGTTTASTSQALTGTVAPTPAAQGVLGWLLDNVWLAIGILLALIAAVVLWLIRLDSRSRTPISPYSSEQVQSQLNDIDLDLDPAPGQNRHDPSAR